MLEKLILMSLCCVPLFILAGAPHPALSHGSNLNHCVSERSSAKFGVNLDALVSCEISEHSTAAIVGSATTGGGGTIRFGAPRPGRSQGYELLKEMYGVPSELLDNIIMPDLSFQAPIATQPIENIQYKTPRQSPINPLVNPNEILIPNNNQI